MNTLRELLQDYLAMRRALGFKLRTEGTGLISFVAFSEERQADHISIALALSWATQPASVQAYRSAQRLSYVRGFARYCSAFDARTEVPPLSLLPFPHRRPSPYFFTDEDIDPKFLC
jgi:integrase/recombinase XerD